MSEVSVIINAEDSFSLDGIIRQESVVEAVLLGLHNLETNDKLLALKNVSFQTKSAKVLLTGGSKCLKGDLNSRISHEF